MLKMIAQRLNPDGKSEPLFQTGPIYIRVLVFH